MSTIRPEAGTANIPSRSTWAVDSGGLSGFDNRDREELGAREVSRLQQEFSPPPSHINLIEHHIKMSLRVGVHSRPCHLLKLTAIFNMGVNKQFQR